MHVSRIKDTLKKGIDFLFEKTGLAKKPPAHGIFIPPPTPEDKKWASRMRGYDLFQDRLETDLINAVAQNNIWRVNHILTRPRTLLFFRQRKIDPTVTVSRGFIELNALGLAAEKGAGDIARLLIHFGCDPNKPMTGGITPLHAAAWRGHKEASAALIAAGAKVDARADNGQTPLMLCAWNGYYELAVMLVDLGAKPNQATDSGRTPLHIAAAANRPNFIRRLAKLGADVNARDGKGETPLMSAAKRGHTMAAVALLDNGAFSEIARRDGQDALSLAVGSNHPDTVEALLARRDHATEETTTLAGATRSPVIRNLLEGHLLRRQGGWRMTGPDEVQHVSINAQTGLRLTDSFNFATQERLLISHDTTTGAQNMIKENFAAIEGSPALDEARKRRTLLKPSAPGGAP